MSEVLDATRLALFPAADANSSLTGQAVVVEGVFLLAVAADY
ncbi:MAG: hypothetical protein OXC05_00160 [Halieaceae bacterium]|nr:hypothetical protein [Halieaceae bacterium]